MFGTVGENCSLEYSEKLDLLRATVDHVAGRIPVLVGCRRVHDETSLSIRGAMPKPPVPTV